MSPSRLRGDDGNAIIEFAFLGVLLLIPLVYAVITALDVEKAAYAVTAASRDAGRVYVREGATRTAYADAFAAARLALRDQGLTLRPEQLRITCARHPCASAGDLVHVRIDASVELPLLPHLGQRTARIAVHGRHDEVVDCYAAGVAAPPKHGTPCE
jgi:hypothetical protein